jgi:hypothetical protein
LFDQIIAQFAQGPSPIRETQLVGGKFSEQPHFMKLSGGKPLGRSSLVYIIHRSHAVGTKCMEISIDRIAWTSRR